MRSFDIVLPVAGDSECLNVVDGETIISRQIRILGEVYPQSKIIVVTGCESAKIRKTLSPKVKIVVNKRYRTTNAAKTIAIGLEHTAEKRSVLVVYGNLVFDAAFITGFSPAQACIATHGVPSEVGVTSVNGTVENMSYGLSVGWSGLVLLPPKEKELFVKLANQEDKLRYFGHEILNLVIEAGGTFSEKKI